MTSENKWPEITALLEAANANDDNNKFIEALYLIKNIRDSQKHFRELIHKHKLLDLGQYDEFMKIPDEYTGPDFEIIFGSPVQYITPSLDFLRGHQSSSASALVTVQCQLREIR